MAKLELIDTHGHINVDEFRDELDQVVGRAKDQGLVAIVVPGDDRPSSEQAVALAGEYPDYAYAAVGLHPTRVVPTGFVPDNAALAEREYEPFDPAWYRVQASQPGVVAIGEVGLDTYRASSQESVASSHKTEDRLAAQERVLRVFIDIALEVAKPIIFHCRGAKKPGDPLAGPDPHERLIRLLTDLTKRPRFVIHCYQGTAAQAERYLALGGFLSFTGSITYSDAEVVRQAVTVVPLDRLMLETDSPYLSPVPYRGERNEPWKVVEVARRVARWHDVSLEEVALQTTQNARSFFGLGA